MAHSAHHAACDDVSQRDCIIASVQTHSHVILSHATIIRPVMARRNGRRFVHTKAQPYRPSLTPFKSHPDAVHTLLKPVQTAGGR